MRGRPGVVLLGIVVAAFNLRVMIAGVGPVIDDIRADTGMSSAQAGVLTGVPFVLIALFSFAGVALVKRTSPARVITLALVWLAGGTLLRAVVPSAVLVLATTVPIGVGIALAGVGLPGVVKAHFAARPGTVTGAYVASLSVGGALAAALMVPLSDALGGWRWAFAASAVPAFLAIPLWHLTVGRWDTGRGLEPLGPLGWLPSRSGLLLGVVFGTQSMTFAGTVSWVAALYVHEGWAPADAALTTASVALLSVPAALVAMRLSHGRSRRAWASASAVTVTVAMLGLALTPETPAWLWAPLFGLGTGALFPLLLTLPLDLADSAFEATDLTSWMLGIGYLLSALAPVVVGALRDLTGGFAIAFAYLAAMGAVSAALVWRVRG
jgi:CP family cyanate transporter-like MFS transporter